jgi:Protein of unknown function (DUF2726)
MDSSDFLVAGLLLAALVLAGVLVMLVRSRRKPQPKPLPIEWDLSARPVFSSDERRVYRQLREALPHHIVLSKLPLVRFCQPIDPQEVRYWYELLGTINVTFAVCSPNGRVLAAVDLDTDRGNSRRVMQIKQSVLGACRVRYLRCPVDHIPSVPELQLLVPHSTAASRGPLPASVLREMPPPTPANSARRGSPRATLWQDSGFFQDSFFGADARDALPSGMPDYDSVSSAAPTSIIPDIDLSSDLLDAPRYESASEMRH